jgi:diguanylate cyclase (GGDEF)-like protein/PAS domain S-box-containing protein
MYLVVVLFVGIVLILMFLGRAEAKIIDSVRAYVAGEGMWAKGQKNAIYFLYRYTETGDEGYYQLYERNIAFCLGDMRARLELEKPEPRMEIVYRGFIDGNNHPEDVARMAEFFLRYRRVEYLSRAIDIWAEADGHIARLRALADALHAMISTRRVSAERLPIILGEIDALNNRLSVLENSFSATLGDAARHVNILLGWTTYMTSMLLLIAGVALSFGVISGIHRTERELRLAALAIENSSEAILVTDSMNKIVSVNRAFTEITGYEPMEVIGSDPNILSSKLYDHSFYSEMWESLKRIGNWKGEIIDRRKNGETYPKWLSISVVKNDHGEIANYVAVFSDITERKNQEEQILHQAHHDFLTGLPNRVFLQKHLSQALAHADRHNERLALLFLDLDHFKNINDSLGHHVGDCLLQEVTERLVKSVRSSDIVSRQGGDEFVILLEGIKGIHEVAIVAKKLLKSMAEPYFIEGHELNISPSIGVGMFPDDGKDILTLMKHADAAMYHAKERGRNTWRFFAEEMEIRASNRLSLERTLRHAIERNEFVVHYQPQVDIRSGVVTGVEALVRWMNPELGLVLPERFIPVAEENGMIIPISEWILREACAQCRAWKQAGLRPISMAVNLSPVQFRRKDMLPKMERIIEDSGMDTACLDLELTESCVMNNPDEAVIILKALKSMGLKLSIDDFGTGYSSLSYLKRFPIDKLKIDQSFVKDIMRDPENTAIVRAIISMARSLDLEVIAEGVETEDQLSFLDGEFCNTFQGYYFSRPLPGCEIEEMLREGRALKRGV